MIPWPGLDAGYTRRRYVDFRGTDCTVDRIKPWIVRTDIDRRQESVAPCAVAVGNFDGVHLGHAEIVRRLGEAARSAGVPAVAFTFDPHPAAVVRPESAPRPLTTVARRADLLLALGVDAVVVQPADDGLLALEAEAFYRRILRGRLQAVALVEGSDFRFGAGRRGDVALLESLCTADGVRLDVVPPVVVGDGPVSSSRIRALVGAGAVAAAAALMTAPYRITGTVVEGARRGGPLGFPTANLAGVATMLPGQGVYAGWATADRDGIRHPAAIHVGPNVSFGATEVSIEAHLVGFSGDLYGATLHVDFRTRLRDTRRFASVDELTAQLAIDVAQAAAIARGGGLPERTP